MNPKSPTNQKELVRLLKQGEGPTLEFKRSTGELKEGMRTLCAFLNGSGGMVFFGVRPEGTSNGPCRWAHAFMQGSQASHTELA